MDELAKDATPVVPDSKDEEEDLVLEDVTLLPTCGHCGRVHDVKDLDTCHLARGKPCHRCELMHNDYMVISWIYSLDDLYCEILIPDVNEVNMDGATLVLPQQVLKKLDDIRKKKESVKDHEMSRQPPTHAKNSDVRHAEIIGLRRA
ncbi:hypothetical protein ABZP36_032293 [Zizania latifolia]